jgi:hypothetical protein
VRYNVRRRRGRHLQSSSSRAATGARGKQRGDIEPQWWFGGLIRVPGGWSTSSSTMTTILGTSPELGAVRRVGGPRARESWPSDSVFLLAVGQLAGVQQHCGGGSCGAATLSV